LLLENLALSERRGDGGDVVDDVLAAFFVADYEVGGFGEGDEGIAFAYITFH
jgi:hypothetical protein